MKPYPHRYVASAGARAADRVMISARDLAPIKTAAPPEFGGPGDLWSPEVLLCAAVADCFVLTFRSIARSARLDWLSLDCRVEGLLEHIGDTAQFTRFKVAVRLVVCPATDTSKARRLLSRAEYDCLIANSLRGERTLCAEVVTGGDAAGPQDTPTACASGEAGLRTGSADRRPQAGQLP